MNTQLKERIDDIWLESEYGKWCKAIANDEVQEANIIKQRIFDSGYLMMGMLEDELAYKIAELIHTESEVDEYLQLLDKENSKLVGVLIHQELFYKVSNHKQKHPSK